MLAAGFLIVFAGYTVGSWGVCLLKGYDITFVEWVDPLHPFQWSNLQPIPDTQILPGAGPAPAGAGTSTPNAKGANPAQLANPAPGNPITDLWTWVQNNLIGRGIT